MTFLNPLVLFGLAAAAIPIILHLLNLRKLKTVEFSSLRFLKELQKTRMRRIRLRQWLLLLLRTLLVVALVMAFARPALRGGLAGVIGTHARTTAVALLDDSPSMSVRSDRGILFARAREAALRAASLLQEGDELTILRLSDIGRMENPAPARTQDEARSLLAAAEVTAVTVPYRDALAVAARLLSASRNFNRELYLLSDLQKTQFTAGAPGDTADLFDDHVRVFLMAPPLPRRDNAGIVDVTVLSRILVPGRPAAVRATIRNASDRPVQNGVLSVYLDGSRVVQQSLDIPPGGSVAPAVTVIPKRTGILHGEVRIEDDALDADNRRSFVLDLPASIRVLVAGPTDAETRLATLALTLAADSAAASLKVRTITDVQLSSVDLSGFDVIVLCGIRRITPSDAGRLGDLVRAGGGLVFFPGEGTEVGAWNSGLFQALGIPPAGPVTDHGNAAPGGAGGVLTFGAVDYAHPLFAGLFDEASEARPGKQRVESPLVRRSLVLHPGPAGQAVITLSDGSPFLAEYPAGAGRALVAAVDAGTAWSDFAMKGLFVPFLHRAASYLAARDGRTMSSLAGQEVRWTLRIADRTDRDVFAVRAPDGVEEKVVPRFHPASGQASFSSSPALTPGVYELRREGTGGPAVTLAGAAVNIDPAESDLEQADPATLRDFWRRTGISPAQVVTVQTDEGLERTVHEARFGVELWKYFAALAALLALLEMVIAREGKRDSPGDSA